MSEMTFRMGLAIYSLGIMSGISMGLVLSMAWAPRRKREEKRANTVRPYGPGDYRDIFGGEL